MDFSEIVRLSVKQRIVLADAIWESISADRKKEPFTDERIEEAQQRINSAEEKPAYLGQWEKMQSIKAKKK